MNEDEFWKIKREIDSKVRERLSKLSFTDKLSYGSFEAYNDVLKEFKQQKPDKYEEFIRFAKENGINVYEFTKSENILAYIIGGMFLIGLAFLIPIIGIPLLIIVVLAILGDKAHKKRKEELRKIRGKLSEDE